MQLNKFTDYALRILMYVSQPKALPHTIAELAQALQVSENHLMKIVHFMAKHEWLITTRGKGGGLRLNPQAFDMRLGQIVRILQGDQQIVECNEPPCVLRNQCGLKGILDQALEQFYQRLDQHTLADVIQPSGQSKFTTHSPIQMINL